MKLHPDEQRKRNEALHEAVDAMCKARDGNGRGVLLYSGEVNARELRKKTLEFLEMHRGEPSTVFFGGQGEEAFWRNAVLMINTLLATIANEGGSTLNQELPL